MSTFADWLDQHVPLSTAELQDGQPELHLVPQSMVVQISEDLLMDCGAIPDTRPRKPVPHRTRLRWRAQAAREQLARRAYRLIAGADAPEGE